MDTATEKNFRTELLKKSWIQIQHFEKGMITLMPYCKAFTTRKWDG